MGLEEIALTRLLWSAKSTYANPLRLSTSRDVMFPNASRACLSSGSVMPCEGLACLTKPRTASGLTAADFFWLEPDLAPVFFDAAGAFEVALPVEGSCGV